MRRNDPRGQRAVLQVARNGRPIRAALGERCEGRWDREPRERDRNANTAKGREGRERVRAFRDVSRFSRSNVLRSEMNHDPTNLAERI